MLKLLLTHMMLLLLGLATISNLFTERSLADVDISELRSPNMDNVTVSDYSGTYSIRDNILYVGHEEVKLTESPLSTTILNKVGNDLYFETKSGVSVYNIDTKSFTQIQGIKGQRIYFTPNGYYRYTDHKLYNQYDEEVVKLCDDPELYYNILLVRDDHYTYLINLNSNHIKRLISREVRVVGTDTGNYDIYLNGDIISKILL